MNFERSNFVAKQMTDPTNTFIKIESRHFD